MTETNYINKSQNQTLKPFFKEWSHVIGLVSPTEASKVENVVLYVKDSPIHNMTGKHHSFYFHK